MEQMITFAIIGKTNVGKTTLFNAATLLNAEISNYPFTTKSPNVGTAYVSDLCVCRELGVEDNPQNSACLEGWRYVPVRLVDVPGLVKDAWRGRGLGNRFLSAIGQADALIHVLDASGSIDEEGKITRPGDGNPVQDLLDVELEVELWISHIIDRNRAQLLRDSQKQTPSEALHRCLTGIKAQLHHVARALELSGLEDKPLEEWSPEDTLEFSHQLLPLAKPTLIIANKMDLASSEENLEKILEYKPDSLVAACSAEAELALRRADKRGLVKYQPGQEGFQVLDEASLTPEQRRAIQYIQEKVIYKYMRTGIQDALNTLAFKLLRMNMVYPVSDEERLSDNHGNVLPDAYLMPPGSTPLDLARQIHTSLAENYILAIDARNRMRLPKDYQLRHRDIIKIVTQRRHRPKA